MDVKAVQKTLNRYLRVYAKLIGGQP
jgi:hypothetical protein